MWQFRSPGVQLADVEYEHRPLWLSESTALREAFRATA
jgi:hypothetical protein